MAVAGSLLTSNSNATPAASYNTDSISPGSNRLILAAVWGIDNAFTTAPTFNLSGNGLTWVSVLRLVSPAAGVGTFQVFRAMGASPSAGVVTIGSDVTTLEMAQWGIFEFTGINTTGTNGSGAIRSVESNVSAASNTVNVTLPAFGSANNATFGVFSAGNDIPSTFNFAPGSGFTELAETVIAALGGGFYFGLQGQWRANNDTSVDVTTSVTSGEILGIALEIVASAPTITGSGALALNPITVAGAGVRRANGAGALSLLPVTVAGAGTRTAKGSGAVLLEVVEVAGSGNVGAVVTGSGDVELAPVEVTGIGGRTSTGQGAIALDALTVSGSGFRAAIGSGSIVLSALEASGAGVVEGVTIGSGSIALPVLGVSGQGFRTATGAGSILLPVLEVLGFGDGAEGDQDILARDSRRRGRVMLIFGRG